jgi:hypothetical protein
MSRSLKRNMFVINKEQLDSELFLEKARGGRVPVIRKVRDREISHHGECWLCNKGTRPKRIKIKATRRAAKKELRQTLTEV